MKTKGHRTKEGLHDIVSIRASINNGLSPKLAAAFPKIIPFVRPAMELVSADLDPQWLVGFVAGDGSFSASPYSDKLKAFRAGFHITQHSRDLELLKAIKNYLGVGNIYKNGNCFNYEVGSYKDCFKYIIPFFSKYPLPPVSSKAFNITV